MSTISVESLGQVYLVTDRKACPGQRLVESVEKALEGGVRLVQLREKDLDGSKLLALAKELREATTRFSARLIVNDRLDVAILSGADGVHLGVSSITPADARKLVDPGFIIGASTHSVQEALKAESSGADFITFGPVHATPSKAQYGAPVGLARLAEAASAVRVPVYAIGGIKAENAPEAIAAGAAGVAIITAVLGAPDPKSAASRLIGAASGRG